MQRRENYLYVGMDLHKDTHTAVLVNCWNEKLDVIVIENKPSEFSKLAKRVNKKANTLDCPRFTAWKTPMAMRYGSLKKGIQ
ncbi:MAG: hypothetical protein QM683_22420 [Lacrimispora sp.]